MSLQLAPSPEQVRLPGHPVEALFVRRWSPRAYVPAGMPHEDLLTMLEAARWAPSAFNLQPWRFLYSHRGDANWEAFTGLLDEYNETWARDASALVFVASDTMMPGRGSRPDSPSRYNSFDTGAAVVQFALQATAMGYHVHTMAGIDLQGARSTLAIPERYRIEVALAVGRQADRALLPEALQAREVPSGRLAVEEIGFAGSFPQAGTSSR